MNTIVYTKREQVFEKLTAMRNYIRRGEEVPSRKDWGEVIGDWLELPVQELTIKHFTPAMVLRLNTLMDIPGTGEPTSDDFAKATQNFINRRKDPWKFYREEAPTDDIEYEQVDEEFIPLRTDEGSGP